MDSQLRYLLRAYSLESTVQNAARLTIAMARAHPTLRDTIRTLYRAAARENPLTAEEIATFPLNDDGTIRVEGLVRIKFRYMWTSFDDDTSIDFERYMDMVSEALIGDAGLLNVETEIVDVEPGEVLIVQVSGDIEQDQITDDGGDEPEIEPEHYYPAEDND